MISCFSVTHFGVLYTLRSCSCVLTVSDTCLEDFQRKIFNAKTSSTKIIVKTGKILFDKLSFARNWLILITKQIKNEISFVSSDCFVSLYIDESEDLTYNILKNTDSNYSSVYKCIIKPTHGIMALIALRKLNLQTRMRSNPLTLHVWYWVSTSSTSILYVCQQRRLFVVRLCNKYHNLMCWLIISWTKFGGKENKLNWRCPESDTIKDNSRHIKCHWQEEKTNEKTLYECNPNTYQ